MSSVSHQHLRVANPSFENKRNILLLPLQPKRGQFGCIEAECVYRIAVSAANRVRCASALECIILDDSLIFKIKDEGIRNAVMRHQHLVNCSIPAPYRREEEIASSLKNILRICERASFSLVSHVPFGQMGEDDMSKYLASLSEMIREKLLTESKEDDERMRSMCYLLEKTRNLQDLIIELSQKFEACESEMQFEKQVKDQDILNLKSCLDTTTLTAAELNNTVLADCYKDTMLTEKNSESRKTRMLQEIANMKAEIAKQKRAHFEVESVLRKRKFKLKGELGNWIHKYDEDMNLRQNELDALQALHDSHVAELDSLLVHFRELEKTYKAIEEEKERFRLETEARQAEEKRRVKAAINIQAVWRGYLVRRDLKASKNAKAKGKTKGKKGGKKKKK